MLNQATHSMYTRWREATLVHLTRHSGARITLIFHSVKFWQGHQVCLPTQLAGCNVTLASRIKTINNNPEQKEFKQDFLTALRIKHAGKQTRKGSLIVTNYFIVKHLTPKGHFSGRTAPLTYRC
jgi:hypothetical protein